MIRALLFVVAFSLSLGMIGQEVSREALTSGGSFFYNEGVSLSVSYGQFVTTTYVGDPANISQGYQQPDYYCFGDFNFDGNINTADLLIFLTGFGCESFCLMDLTFDGASNTTDLLLFLTVFGTACQTY